MLDGSPHGGETITVQITAASASIYGSPGQHHAGPSVQFARRSNNAKSE